MKDGDARTTADRDAPQEGGPTTLTGASHAVALTRDDLETLLSRAIEDTRGGGWGSLLVGSFLLLLGLGLGSVVVRDRVADGTAALRDETAVLRDEVSRLREVAMRPVVVAASTDATPPVAEKVALAQRVEAASTEDRIADLTRRENRLNEERLRVRAELDRVSAKGRMLTAEQVGEVLTGVFDRQLALIEEDRERAAALSRRQRAMSEAVLSEGADDEAFASPIQERVRQMLPPPTTPRPSAEDVEQSPADTDPTSDLRANERAKPTRPSAITPSPTPPQSSNPKSRITIQGSSRVRATEEPSEAADDGDTNEGADSTDASESSSTTQPYFAVPPRDGNTTFAPRRGVAEPRPLPAPGGRRVDNNSIRFASESRLQPF